MCHPTACKAARSAHAVQRGARRRPPGDPSTQRPTNRPGTWCGPLIGGPISAPTSRSGGGSGAPSPQRIRPARGTGEAGAAGGAPAWPQFPLPARRPHRPLSDNGALSDLPLPRNPPLRPAGLHNTCVMQTTGRGTRPALAGGAHGRAPCTPGARRAVRLGRMRPTGLTARHHFHSEAGPDARQGRSNHAGLTGPPVLRPGRTALSVVAASPLSPIPVKRGGTLPTGSGLPAPLGRGGRPCPQRSSRSRVRSFALAPSPRASMVCGAPHRTSISRPYGRPVSCFYGDQTRGLPEAPALPDFRDSRLPSPRRQEVRTILPDLRWGGWCIRNARRRGD